MQRGIIHVHSSYSHDGKDSLEDLAAFGARTGLSFIGLTDHAEDLDAARYRELREKCVEVSRSGVSIIPGLEFRFRRYIGLHLLALDITEFIEPATPEEFIAATRDTATLTIAAHPVLFRYRLPPAVRGGIDAIEVWNAQYNTRYLPDPRAIRLLHDVRRERPGVVGTAGPDQHDSRIDREVRIVVDDADREPLVAIREGRFMNQGRTMTFDPAVSWSAPRVMATFAARAALDLVSHVQDRLSARRA